MGNSASCQRNTVVVAIEPASSADATTLPPPPPPLPCDSTSSAPAPTPAPVTPAVDASGDASVAVDAPVDASADIALDPAVARGLATADAKLFEQQVKSCHDKMREMVQYHKHDPINSHNWPYYVTETLAALRSRRDIKSIPKQRRVRIVNTVINREVQSVADTTDQNEMLLMQASIANSCASVAQICDDLSGLKDPLTKLGKQFSDSCCMPHVSVNANQAVTDPSSSTAASPATRGVHASASVLPGVRKLSAAITERLSSQQAAHHRDAQELRRQIAAATGERNAARAAETEAKREQKALAEATESRIRDLLAKHNEDIVALKTAHKIDIQQTKADAAATYGRSVVPTVAVGSASAATAPSTAGASPQPQLRRADVTPTRALYQSPTRQLGAPNA